jgi:hypothetical protein
MTICICYPTIYPCYVVLTPQYFQCPCTRSSIVFETVMSEGQTYNLIYCLNGKRRGLSKGMKGKKRKESETV